MEGKSSEERTRPHTETEAAMPDAAGGELGHGAARPDGVIHKYNINFTAQFMLNHVRA